MPNKSQSATEPAKIAGNEEAKAAVSLVRKRIPKKTKVKLIIAGILLAIVCSYLVWDKVCSGPLTSFTENGDQIIRAIRSHGVLGPLFYIFLQAIQIIIAPIPGQVVGAAGGLVFGVWGILWTTIGTAIGSYIVFRLARKFGRPLLENIFKKSVVAEFDFILESESAGVILFIIFLLPYLPDDVVCYIAGLTKIPIRRLMLILLAGRFPMIVFTNIFGDNLNNPIIIAVSVIIAAVFFGLTIWKRDLLMRILKGEKTLRDFKKPKK